MVDGVPERRIDETLWQLVQRGAPKRAHATSERVKVEIGRLEEGVHALLGVEEPRPERVVLRHGGVHPADGHDPVVFLAPRFELAELALRAAASVRFGALARAEELGGVRERSEGVAVFEELA